MKFIKAGIVGLGFQGYSGNCVQEITARVIKDLRTTGKFDITDVGEIQNYEQGQDAVKRFSPHGFDMLILVVASWPDARGAMPFVLANKQLPMVVYATGAKTREDGVLLSPAAGAGAPGLLEPMRAVGANFNFIYEEPDSQTKTDEIFRYACAAAAVNALRNTRIGSMGFDDMGLYCTNFDNTAVRNTYGVATEFFDMLEVENAAKALDKKQVDTLVDILKRDWSVLGKTPQEATYKRVAELTLAVGN